MASNVQANTASDVSSRRPQRGKHPDISGVPGEIVSIVGVDLVWGDKKRKSPYDPLLDQLLSAGPGKALKFCDIRARVSIMVRSRKKNMKVSCAELNDCLYVRYDGPLDDTAAQILTASTRRARILDLLTKAGPRKVPAITKRLLDDGDATVDATLVTLILSQLQRSGEVVCTGDVWAMYKK